MLDPIVIPVPCLSDNYAYLVHAPGSTAALVVDPSEAAPVLSAAERAGLSLVGVLATHHHFDHVGGNEDLARAVPGLLVVCSEHDRARVPAATRAVRDEEQLGLAGLSIRVLNVPGHTLGAVAYVIGDAVFTGDTLFIAGCGRLFEGTPADMTRSLCEVLGRLPASTRVYCGHEYTLANAAFAATVEPENPAVQALVAAARSARARGEPTVPSSIGAELLHNPFLRVGQPALRARFGLSDPVELLARVRKDKDTFKAPER